MLALYDRERTGEGQWVHTSLIEAQIFMLDFQAVALADRRARSPSRPATTIRPAIPTGVFPTADGHINIAASGDNLWKRFCEALGAPELLDHPEYATAPLRSQEPQGAQRAHRRDHQDQAPSAHWIEALNKAGVPCGPINTIDQAFAEPQVQHLGIARAGRASQARRHQGGRPADQPDRLAAAQEAEADARPRPAHRRRC